MQKPLLLASSSASRQQLLSVARIPYRVVVQQADERSCSWALPVEQLVLSLAKLKMSHAEMPQDLDQSDQYVLAADTLTQDEHGVLYGKPDSHEDAIVMLRGLRGKSLRVATGFYIERRSWNAAQHAWVVADSHEAVIVGACSFYIPDEDIERYLSVVPGVNCSAAMAIEGYGMQFVKEVSGSYSAIVGLPLYEVSQALRSLGFSW